MDGEYSYFSYCNEVATSIFTLLHKRSSSLEEKEFEIRKWTFLQIGQT